jgi:glycosyltransferase involved in cell wall biosynthesis
VLPTLEDGFAVATGEALACGLPVITTVSNGASDVITHGHNGFVVEARSPEAIASCLELLYRDRELRASMSKAAAATARTTLSWETYARKLCMFYAEILARPLTAEREEG